MLRETDRQTDSGWPIHFTIRGGNAVRLVDLRRLFEAISVRTTASTPHAHFLLNEK